MVWRRGSVEEMWCGGEVVWRRGGVEERWYGEGMKRYNLNASCKPTQVYTHCVVCESFYE